MAKISNAKGRTDGGYTRLFGDAELGHLASQIQAATISAGNELEKLVEEQAKAQIIPDLDDFLSTYDSYPYGIYVVNKKVLKRSSFSSSYEPDYMVFIHKPGTRTCKIIELKDGDNFDTKKASGEVANIVAFQTHISARIPYITDWAICCFNVDSREKVVEGFKHKITEEHALTGREFCELINIDYLAICRLREQDQEENRDYLFSEIKRISQRF